MRAPRTNRARTPRSGTIWSIPRHPAYYLVCVCRVKLRCETHALFRQSPMHVERGSMTNGNEPRPSKNQRRDAAREKARQLREEQKKKDRRKRILLQTGIGVALIAIVAIVVVIITSSVRPAGPGPKNMA